MQCTSLPLRIGWAGGEVGQAGKPQGSWTRQAITSMTPIIAITTTTITIITSTPTTTTTTTITTTIITMRRAAQRERRPGKTGEQAAKQAAEQAVYDRVSEKPE